MAEPVMSYQGNPEQHKYEQMWSRPEYRKYAPGEALAFEFLKHVSPPKHAEIIDFGAGTGRGALLIAALTGCKVTMLDFAANCLDEEVADAVKNQNGMLNFIQHDLTQKIPVTAPYGYCTDVMEHIPPEDVDCVLRNILKSAQRVFFQISLEDDACGKLIGEKLHLTVQPMHWWLKKFRDFNCNVYFSYQNGENGVFYVSGWQDGEDFAKTGRVNTDFDTLVSNIRTNVAANYQQATPHIKNNVEIMILGGGPSLDDFEDEIRKNRTAGMPLVCTNATYNWCLERGITPSALVIVDARPFNSRFISQVVPSCKYFFASQCHPSLFETVPREQIWMWHSVASNEAADVLDSCYGDELWYPVPGGSTVMLRAFVLFRMLGFHKMHVYGFDSCMRDDAHHAYPQVENDAEVTVNVTIADRTFRCQAWMASQAQEFIEQMKMMGDEVDLNVRGDGLISHIINTAAASKLEVE